MKFLERNKIFITRAENFNYILLTTMFVLLETLALSIFAEEDSHI